MTIFYGQKPYAPFDRNQRMYDGNIVGYDINGNQIIQQGYNSGDMYIDRDGRRYRIKQNYTTNQIQGYPNGGYLSETTYGSPRERVGRRYTPLLRSTSVKDNSTTGKKIASRDGTNKRSVGKTVKKAKTSNAKKAK